MNPENNNAMPPVEEMPHTQEVPQEQPAPTEAPVASMPSAQKEKEGVGPMVGVAIIVVLLIFGGLYVWGTMLNTRMDTNDETGEIFAPSDELATPADEPAAIEASLDAFDSAAFEAQLDADMKAIEAAF